MGTDAEDCDEIAARKGGTACREAIAVNGNERIKLASNDEGQKEKATKAVGTAAEDPRSLGCRLLDC